MIDRTSPAYSTRVYFAEENASRNGSTSPQNLHLESKPGPHDTIKRHLELDPNKIADCMFRGHPSGEDLSKRVKLEKIENLIPTTEKKSFSTMNPELLPWKKRIALGLVTREKGELAPSSTDIPSLQIETSLIHTAEGTFPTIPTETAPSCVMDVTTHHITDREEYRVFLSQQDEYPSKMEEKDCYIIPLPFQQASWMEVVKLANSIMTLSEQNSQAVQEHLREVTSSLQHLSRDEIRRGEIESLSQALLKGEHAVKFWTHLNALKQNIRTDLPFQTMYRMEFFEFIAQRVYIKTRMANPEAEQTIRLYKKRKENGSFHYDLLISKK